MKKQKNILKKAKSRKPESIKDALTGFYRSSLLFETLSLYFKSVRFSDSSKAPPGRSRSPGTVSCLIPDNITTASIDSKTFNINKLHY